MSVVNNAATTVKNMAIDTATKDVNTLNKMKPKTRKRGLGIYMKNVIPVAGRANNDPKNKISVTMAVGLQPIRKFLKSSCTTSFQEYCCLTDR